VSAAARLLQPLVVESETLYQVLPEHRRRPLPELGSPVGSHPVPDRQDHVQAVDLDRPPHLAGTLLPNYFLGGNSCLALLALVQHGGDVLVDIRYTGGKQCGDLGLGQPDGAVDGAQFDPGTTVIAPVDDDLAGRSVVGHG